MLDFELGTCAAIILLVMPVPMQLQWILRPAVYIVIVIQAYIYMGFMFECESCRSFSSYRVLAIALLVLQP